MKKLTLLFLVTLLISCIDQDSSRKNIIATSPYLLGKWSGEGGFLNVDLDREFGNVLFEIEIKEDNTIIGKMGKAHLTNTKIAKANYGFEIRGILSSKIKDDKDLKKDHLIVLAP